MDRDELLALYDREIRYGSAEANFRREVTPEVVRHVPLNPHAPWGWVNWSHVTAENADRVIREQIAYFTEHNFNFEWKLFGYDGPPDLGERLLAAGFAVEPVESVMILDLEEAPATQWEPREQEVRRVTDRAGLDEIVRIEDEVWNTPHAWIAEELEEELKLPGEPTVVYIAYADGEPAAAGWIRFLPPTQFAGLFGGSTLPGRRNRGLYTALLAARGQEARRRGVRFLEVDASEMSRPILEKHGFVKVTTATAYKYRIRE